MNEIPFSLSLNTETVVALITLAGVILSIGYGRAANKNANAANCAVNNRGPNEPVIYEMVRDTYKTVLNMEGWKDSYEGGPLDSGDKVVAFVDRVDTMHGDIINLYREMQETRKDVKKYGCPVKMGQSDDCVEGRDE